MCWEGNLKLRPIITEPLVPLLRNESLDSLPPRVLWFRLRLTRFQYTIRYVPGKEFYTPDTLSRAPLPNLSNKSNSISTDDIELFIQTVVNQLPADKDRLNVYRQAQASDPICSKLIEYCKSGWPCQQKPKGVLGKYWMFSGELSLCDDLLLFGSRIIVPKTMRKVTLQKIHQRHQGIQKCQLRVKKSVWWPGVSRDMENFINSCPECQKTMNLPREPLLQTPLPTYPWEKVTSDLYLNTRRTLSYILVVDYFSRYVCGSPEDDINNFYKYYHCFEISICSSWGTHHTGHRQSEDLNLFHKKWMNFHLLMGFNHVTSSPHYP